MNEQQILRRRSTLRRRTRATRIVGALVVAGAVGLKLADLGGTAVYVALGVVAVAVILCVGVPTQLELARLRRAERELGAA